MNAAPFGAVLFSNLPPLTESSEPVVTCAPPPPRFATLCETSVLTNARSARSSTRIPAPCLETTFEDTRELYILAELWEYMKTPPPISASFSVKLNPLNSADAVVYTMTPAPQRVAVFFDTVPPLNFGLPPAKTPIAAPYDASLPVATIFEKLPWQPLPTKRPAAKKALLSLSVNPTAVTFEFSSTFNPAPLPLSISSFPMKLTFCNEACEDV